MIICTMRRVEVCVASFSAAARQAENILYPMGCAPVHKQQPLERKDSPIGILKVTVYGVHIHQGITQSRPQLKIRVSNQHFTSYNLPLIVQDTKAGDCFSFVVNSCYKPYGRTIEIGYFSGDKLLSYCAVDANPLVYNRGHQDFRCILSDKQNEKGFVLVKAVFEPLPFYELTFRFQTAAIRRKTGTCGQDNVAVRLTIGEEILETEYQKDSLKKPPVWLDKNYNFKVPQGVTKGLLALIDDRAVVVGQAELNLQEFQIVKEEDEVLQSQELFFNDSETLVNAADLKYSFILGGAHSFKPRTEMFTSAIRAVRAKNQFQTPLDKTQTN